MTLYHSKVLLGASEWVLLRSWLCRDCYMFNKIIFLFFLCPISPSLPPLGAAMTLSSGQWPVNVDWSALYHGETYLTHASHDRFSCFCSPACKVPMHKTASDHMLRWQACLQMTLCQKAPNQHTHCCSKWSVFSLLERIWVMPTSVPINLPHYRIVYWGLLPMRHAV